MHFLCSQFHTTSIHLTEAKGITDEVDRLASRVIFNFDHVANAQRTGTFAGVIEEGEGYVQEGVLTPHIVSVLAEMGWTPVEWN